MLVTCVRVKGHDRNLTHGQQYEVVEEDEGKDEDKDLVRVRLPDGRLRRFPRLCFDLVPALVAWKFDDEIEDEVHQGWCPEVTFTLTDGTRRWCVLATPQFLIRYLGPPLPQPRFWASNLIVVRSYADEAVEEALRHLDEQGELIVASKLIESGETEDEPEPDNAIP